MIKQINNLIIIIMTVILPIFFVSSCARDGFIYDLWDDESLKDDYNYQTGCENSQFASDVKPEVHSFFGGSMFNYSSYQFDQSNNIFFNGNKQNLYNCKDQNYNTSSWKGEFVNIQNILVIDDINKISDLKVEIKGVDFDIKEDNNSDQISGWVRFLKFMDTPRADENSPHMLYRRQIIPDAVGRNSIEKIKYDVQPIYISIKIGNHTSTGLKKFKLIIKYKFNNSIKNKESEFSIQVKNIELDINQSKKNSWEKFGFTVPTYPAQGIKYWDNYCDEPDNPLEGPTNDIYTKFMSSENNINLLKKHLQPLRDSNSLFAFGVGFHKQLIQYIGTFDDGDKWTPEEYHEYIKKNDFKKIIQEKKWTFKFNFSGLNKYMEILSEMGFEYLDLSLLENGNFSFWMVPPKSEKGLQEEFNAQIINSSSGKPASDFELFMKNVNEPLIDSLFKNLEEQYKLNKFKTKNGNKLKIKINMDELNEETIHKYDDFLKEKAIKNGFKNLVDSPIGMNSFIGWRATSNYDDDNYMKNNFVNSFDQHIVNLRELSDQFNNQSIRKFRNFVKKRNLNKKTTLFYSTFNEYPGTYVFSDPSELYWNVLFAKKIGMNGFARWAYDKQYDDYYNTEIINKTDNLTHEPGQSFLTYGGGSDNIINYSTRMLSLIDAVEQAQKYQYIIENYSTDIVKKANMAINSIGWSPYAKNNSEYKWNINKKFNFIFSNPPNDYKVTVQKQVYAFFNFIDNLV